MVCSLAKVAYAVYWGVTKTGNDGHLRGILKQKIILFDINETVLSLKSLRPKFHAALHDERLTDTWFSMLLHASTVSMVTAVKADFASLAKISLTSLAARLGIELSNDVIDDILSTFAELSPHADIKPALSELREAGFKTAALSNSSRNLISKQIENAALGDFFDEVISVQESGTFKPSGEAYELASMRLGRAKQDLRLVAAHDWDTHGALCAGLDAAYINRTGSLYNPLYKKPDIVAATMQEIVVKIILADK